MPGGSWPGSWGVASVTATAAGVPWRGGLPLPEICCSPAIARHPRYYSNPHYREMSSHSSTTTTQRCYTAPWGDRAFFRSCWREQSEQHGEEELMPSGVSCRRGVRTAPSRCQLFLSSVLAAPIIIFTNENMANCLLQACICHQLIHEDFRASPTLHLIYLCSQAPAAVLGTQ